MSRSSGMDESLSKEMMVLKNKLPEASFFFHPERTVTHPEEQVSFVNNVFTSMKSGDGYPIINDDVVIVTDSLLMIYAINNALMLNPKIKVRAYEILLGDKKVLVSKKDKRHKHYWVDEEVLGHVQDRLSQQINTLMRDQFKKLTVAKFSE